ncbi:MAG: glycosyltransferase, partial [Propionicimonas sp.]
MPQPAEPNRDRRPTVVILDHTGALGGAELALLRLIRALSPADASITVVLFSDGPLAASLRKAGAAVELLPMGATATLDRDRSGRTPWRAIGNAVRVLPFVIRLGRRLRRLRPDLIHSTSLKADLLAVPASWIAGRPLVWHVHDRISPDYLPSSLVVLIRWLARWAPRRVVVNSQATAATVPGVRRPAIAYPGLLPEQLIAAPGAGRPPARHLIGMLGRISPTKGQLVFVRAAAQVLET